MRKWRALSRRGVTPIWIATALATLSGVILIALSSAMGTFWPGGASDPLFVGDVLVALGVGLGMIGGHVRNPYMLALIPSLVAMVLIGASFGWFGPGVKL